MNPDVKLAPSLLFIITQDKTFDKYNPDSYDAFVNAWLAS